MEFVFFVYGIFFGIFFVIIFTELWAMVAVHNEENKGSLENMVLNDSYSFMILSDICPMICVRSLWDEIERTLRKVSFYLYFYLMAGPKLFKRKVCGMSFFRAHKAFICLFLFCGVEGGMWWKEKDGFYFVCVLLISFDLILISSYKQIVIFYLQTRKQTIFFSNKVSFFLIFAYVFCFFLSSQECSL